MIFISITSLLAILAGAIVVLTGAQAKGAEKKPIPCDPEKAKKFLGRKDLSDLLQKLSQSKAPTELSMGAKCYDIAQLNNTVQFVCSTCKQKTAWVESELSDLRKMQRIIQVLSPKLDMTLDDRFFCGHCNKDKSIKSLFLIVRLHDACEEIVSPIDSATLERIQALLEGKDRTENQFGQESALKDDEKLLRAVLLGE